MKPRHWINRDNFDKLEVFVKDRILHVVSTPKEIRKYRRTEDKNRLLKCLKNLKSIKE